VRTRRSSPLYITRFVPLGPRDYRGTRGATSITRSHSSGGCGIRTREGLHPTRFPSLPSAVRRCSDQTGGRPLQAWQPIVNPDERPRMRLKLRLALRLNWRDGGPRKIVITPCLQSDGVDLAKRRSGALSVGEPRCTALSSGDTAVLCCCTGSLRRSFRHRLSVFSADLVRLAATGWRRPKWGVEYELPKLNATVLDH
jgi:hypothetical protein